MERLHWVARETILFRSLTEEEASRVERWHAPRIGEAATVSEGRQSPLHQIDITATAGPMNRVEGSAVPSADDSLHPSASMVQQAYDEGYSKGLADAEERSSQRGVQMLEPLIKTLGRQVKLQELAYSDELMQLARAMATLILHREIREDPDVIAGFVDQAVNALDIRDGVPEIRINDKDLALISEAGLDDPDLLWTPDVNLPRGSCIVDSGASRIRNGIEEQLKRLIVDFDLASPTPDSHDLEAA